ncbi:MAG TPA: response regulator [Candidatus Acidoferrales bacterium]
MSDATIFSASHEHGVNHGMNQGFGESAFQHTSLDPDASARLAAMDRAVADDSIMPSQVAMEFLHPAESQAHSQNHSESQSASNHGSQDEDAILAALLADSADAPTDSREIELAEVESVRAESAPSEPAETIAAEPAARQVTEILPVHEVTNETIPEQSCATEESTEASTVESSEEISIIETAVVDADLNLESAAAPALLEVAPILDASGELQPDAEEYTPPAPFRIHVPDALVADQSPIIADAEPILASAGVADVTETFDLDSLCAPTEAEQIIEQAIAQEEAVAEMSAVAAEFVAEQIASECAAEDPAEVAACTEQVSAVLAAACSSISVPSSMVSAAHALKAEPAEDRRRKRRALISSPIRVRGIHVTTSGPDEITSTVDVSRYGILFHTVLDTYQRGMDVAVVFPYHKSATGAQAEQFGRVVRLHELPDGRQAVAIALGVGVGEHLVDSNGRQLSTERVQLSNSTAPQVKPPLVLTIDSDAMLRDTMKLFLQNEGYEVIAVSTANDAREVLNMFMPAMIVAEMEGEGESMPGLDLCAHVKSSPSLKKIPVVLTSRSGYPSDYSNAHSLGAVVCMAKPYKMERLGHIVRLLAPLPEQLQPVCTQRPPDPTRGFGRDSNVTQRNGNGASRNGAKKSNVNGNGAKSRFKFPSFR